MIGVGIRAMGLLFAAVMLAPAALYPQLQLPQPTGYVNDFAGVIAADAESRIHAVIEEVRAKSGGEIAVVTLTSLEGRTRHEVALQILREWGVGASGAPGDSTRNTGTVLLVVPKETSPDGRGHVEISLGYTTNTFITAAEAGRIRDQAMMPHLREADYGAAILAGVIGIAEHYGERFGFEVTGQAPAQPRQRGRSGGGGIGAGEIIFFVFLMMFLFGRGGGGGRGRRRRRGFGMPVILPFPIGHRGGFGGFGGGGGGFGGGGFGGFGGGMGGGGGAGGSW